MDSTGGDLSHAVQEIEIAAEKQSLHNNDDLSNLAVGGDKLEHGIQSSGSSSQESAPLKKLDSKVVNVKSVKEGEEAYAHLPEHEREIVRRQLEIPPVKVTFITLYRYATRNDLIIIAISALCAVIGGAVMPLMTVSIPQVLIGDLKLTPPGHLRTTGRHFPAFL